MKTSSRLPLPLFWVVAPLTVLACGSSSPATKADATAPAGGVDAGLDAARDSGLDAPPPLLFFPARDAGHDAPRALPDTGAPRPDAPSPTDASDGGGPGIPDGQLPPPTDAVANTFPAFSPDVPQIQNYGGLVLSKPVFVPVIFADDEYAAEIPTFLSAIGASDYWNEAVAEYGVGKATATDPIVLDETMPSSITDVQLQVWLQNRIGSDPRFLAIKGESGHADAGHHGHDAGQADAATVSLDASAPLSPDLDPEAKAPDQAVYVIFIPAGTTVTESGGGVSCGDTAGSFDAYHTASLYTPNGSPILSAIIPRCAGYGGGTGFIGLTGAVSHELAEASTDPEPQFAPAYLNVDSLHEFWSIELSTGSFGEVGDMCQANPGAFFVTSEADFSGFGVQRIWSNKAAAAGEDPCRPVPSSEPFYFNAVPKLAPEVTVLDGENFQVLSVVAPPNVPTTVEIDLFSNSSTQGQSWTVEPYNPYTGGPADLVFSPTTLRGSNGDRLNFTVTNLNTDGQSAHPFFVRSTFGDLANLWVGVVTNP